jgi:hypothetical protein
VIAKRIAQRWNKWGRSDDQTTGAPAATTGAAADATGSTVNAAVNASTLAPPSTPSTVVPLLRRIAHRWNKWGRSDDESAPTTQAPSAYGGDYNSSDDDAQPKKDGDSQPTTSASPSSSPSNSFGRDGTQQSGSASSDSDSTATTAAAAPSRL